jgi:hypothetical protein
MTVASASNNAFRVGDVISQSLQTTLRNIVPFGVVAVISVAIIAVLFMLLSSIFGMSMMMPGQMDPSMGMPALGAGVFIGMTIFGLLAFAIYMLVVAAIVYGTVQDLRGQRVGIGELLTTTTNLVGPVLGTVVILIGVGIVADIIAYVLHFIPVLGQIASLVMFAFLYIALWVAIPVAVIERPGPIASLQRSFDLTSGNRWKILGIFLLVMAIVIGIVIVMMILMFVSTALTVILLLLFYAGLFIFSAVLVATGYYRLRVAKEGADIGDIARVFD